MALASILLVDADTAARGIIARELRELGHDVSETGDAESALKLVRRKCPDLVVCDFALPDLGGVELLSDVRRSNELRNIRILMTSGRKDEGDVMTALESGADDFIGKPINRLELRARVSACLRRPASISRAGTIDAGGIRIDNAGHRVSVDGKPVTLAPREYRLLQFLASNPERVFPRQQLLAHVWDRNAAVGARTVDVHIRRLRSVLEPFGCDQYLQTVRGSGYRFSLDP
ncbi:MAG: winged helix-turn-helix domain-containing protein [Woeseiaceae bacterium]|jgi:two-component system phosphate regulon response regulator PhoB|nr:winged helix-turn-helix domain-containing protein [Woeseiaceae bacterium]